MFQVGDKIYLADFNPKRRSAGVREDTVVAVYRQSLAGKTNGAWSLSRVFSDRAAAERKVKELIASALNQLEADREVLEALFKQQH